MKKHVEKRRERMQRLAANDAMRRCTFCRRELPRVGMLILLTPSGKTLRYCNDNCRQDHVDAVFTLEERR